MHRNATVRHRAMKPERAVNAVPGEIAGDAGCKLFEALRQIPPSPCTVKGAGMNRKWAIPGTRTLS